MLKVTTILVVLSAVFCLVAVDAHAQTTEFTYQGSFKDGAGPANGNYDFEFKLFDLVSGGVQQGITLQRLNVPVVNGIFTVSLDFGVGTFPGASRFLDIGARTAGGGTFTGLIPRQKVNSAPYAVRSLNAATADSVAAGGIPAGSSNYIQNTAAPQSGSNFNITGNGTIGGNLTVNQGVTAAGDVFVNTGSLGLGTQTMNHRFNVVGSPCWTSDCWGGAVSLENAASIGWKVNSAGTRFGIGRTNAGLLFFRTSAELGTTSGGPLYDLKVDNSGNVGIGNLGISTPIEQRMTVFTSSGTYGFAHTDGTVTLSSFVDSTGGWLGTRSNHPLHFYTNNGAAIMTIGANGNIGIGTAPGGVTKLIIAGNVATFGDLSNGFAQAGSTSVCRNGTIFAACSSSLRYKTDVQPFTEGMKYINDLQPIVFTWKIDGARDIGFGAEDVEKIDPLFVTYNDKKQVEGVKYDRLSVAFVNAFKEQQSQIEKQQTTIQLQQKQIDEQRRQIEALMRVVCSQTNEPTVCRHP